MSDISNFTIFFSIYFGSFVRGGEKKLWQRADFNWMAWLPFDCAWYISYSFRKRMHSWDREPLSSDDVFLLLLPPTSKYTHEIKEETGAALAAAFHAQRASSTMRILYERPTVRIAENEKITIDRPVLSSQFVVYLKPSETLLTPITFNWLAILTDFNFNCTSVEQLALLKIQTNKKKN